MNKMLAIEKLAATRYDGNKEEAEKALNNVLDLLMRTVIDGEPFRITGFGTMETEYVGPRNRRNPQTGDRIETPSSIRIKWIPGQSFKDLANGDKEIADLPAFINAKSPKGTYTSNEEN